MMLVWKKPDFVLPDITSPNGDTWRCLSSLKKTNISLLFQTLSTLPQDVTTRVRTERFFSLVDWLLNALVLLLLQDVAERSWRETFSLPKSTA